MVEVCERSFEGIRKSQQPLTLISTGQDPQLILPLLPGNVGFPLIMSVEMKLIPYE